MAVNSFGERLRKLRKSNGLSQRKFARMLNVHHVYISQIERGLEVPSENLIKRVAEIFNISNIDELVACLVNSCIKSF